MTASSINVCHGSPTLKPTAPNFSSCSSEPAERQGYLHSSQYFTNTTNTQGPNSPALSGCSQSADEQEYPHPSQYLTNTQGPNSPALSGCSQSAEGQGYPHSIQYLTNTQGPNSPALSGRCSQSAEGQGYPHSIQYLINTQGPNFSTSSNNYPQRPGWRDYSYLSPYSPYPQGPNFSTSSNNYPQPPGWRGHSYLSPYSPYPQRSNFPTLSNNHSQSAEGQSSPQSSEYPSDTPPNTKEQTPNSFSNTSLYYRVYILKEAVVNSPFPAKEMTGGLARGITGINIKEDSFLHRNLNCRIKNFATNRDNYVLNTTFSKTNMQFLEVILGPVSLQQKDSSSKKMETLERKSMGSGGPATIYVEYSHSENIEKIDRVVIPMETDFLSLRINPKKGMPSPFAPLESYKIQGGDVFVSFPDDLYDLITITIA